jgi:hypothetical protein
MPSRIVLTLAFPFYQVRFVIKYTNTYQGWPAKVGTFLCFLPIIAMTTAIWAAVWAMGLSLALLFVK